MSTEIQVPETVIPQATAAPADLQTSKPAAIPTANKPQPWNRRRVQVAAAAIVALLLAGIVGNNLIARQYTPEGAVRQFLSALQSRDAAAVWNVIQVAAPTRPAAATLTDEASLRAALATTKPDLKSFDVVSAVNANATTVIVAASYETSGGAKQGNFVVMRSGEKRFAIYPTWRVLVTPALLEVALPKGGAGITVDGKVLALQSGKSIVAVLPLAHKLQFNGTQMLAAHTVSAGGFLSLGESVPYQPQLTAAGSDAARTAIKVYFDNCAKLATATPDSQTCPQWSNSGSSGHWHLVGDPTQDLATRLDFDLNIAVVGHYQMLFSYPGDSAGAGREASAGGYTAAIVLSPSDLKIASIQSLRDLPGLTRPAGATDPDALALARKGLVQCAAVRAEFVTNCPQVPPYFGITNVRWTLVGNPLVGATVSFDSNSGVFTVHGSFEMSVSYHLFGFPRTGSSWHNGYYAHLLWDGQALQLINIGGDID
jgi:hypothetical protein